MAKTADEKRIESLRAEIARSDELYYRETQPEISDSEYDALKRELEGLEKQYPELSSADSPTNRVGTILVMGSNRISIGCR